MYLLLFLACKNDAPAKGTEGFVLSDAVDVRFDAMGVPHIYASTNEDLFYMQGYVTAHQRFFEMDMVRRRTQGRRAEILGEAYYESDLQSRALRFAAWGETTAAALSADDPEAYGWFEAYAAGVNRYLDDVDAGLQALPPQMTALGYTPDRWTAADSLGIEKLLTAGLSMRPDQDLILGFLWLLIGEDAFTDIYSFAPFDREYVVPSFSPTAGPAVPVRRQPSGLPELPDDVLLAGLKGAEKVRMSHGGSNGQAVAGALSASGAALLAGDSHQGVEHPAVYYYLHLNTRNQGGDLDVIGASFPGVPMVMFGHNQDIAWAPTTSIYDVADVYLETFADADLTSVSFEGGAVPVETYTETILVRTEGGSVADAEARTVTTRVVPHHGPMFPEEVLPLPLAVSIRWTGYQPRSVARAFYGLGTASSYDDFQAALGALYTGGEHWVVAESDGHIGYTSRVDVPVREVLDPSHPPFTLLPGTGGYEWLETDGVLQILPDTAIPAVHNPDDGILTTANNDPAGFTDDNDPFNDSVYISAIFDIGTRAYQPRRAFEERYTEGPLDSDDVKAVQTDTGSRLGERLVPFLLAAAERRPDLVDDRMALAIEKLAAWDYTCGTEQVEPTLFHAWLAITGREVLADEEGGLIGEMILPTMDYQLGLVVVKFLARWLEATDADIDAIEAGTLPFPSATGINYFDNQDTPELETRDEILLNSLSMALAELSVIYTNLGADPDDMETWTWGRWHVMELVDLAHAVLPEASSAPLPKPGGLYTVDVGDFNWLEDGVLPAQLTVTNAPSNRFVFEVKPGAIEAWWSMPGGQSERPGDPHHNDWFEEYLAGEYREMVYYDDAVTADTSLRWSFPAGYPSSGSWTAE